ncbi:hypothetical protein B0T25DRAFT_567846 [Lasiosphaeria hispida]|uniref:Uncharacterized protein n=1 Tax=Lasiosphaeria hispida TaxID=260671 RepID=A0AAJ0MDN0_9PEZI|nr:hypothetical protein B0T25DRAFT_567846 [Lasiosphaeria hispida]
MPFTANFFQEWGLHPATPGPSEKKGKARKRTVFDKAVEAKLKAARVVLEVLVTKAKEDFHADIEAANKEGVLPTPDQEAAMLSDRIFRAREEAAAEVGVVPVDILIVSIRDEVARHYDGSTAMNVSTRFPVQRVDLSTPDPNSTAMATASTAVSAHEEEERSLRDSIAVGEEAIALGDMGQGNGPSLGQIVSTPRPAPPTGKTAMAPRGASVAITISSASSVDWNQEFEALEVAQAEEAKRAREASEQSQEFASLDLQEARRQRALLQVLQESEEAKAAREAWEQSRRNSADEGAVTCSSPASVVTVVPTTPSAADVALPSVEQACPQESTQESLISLGSDESETLTPAERRAMEKRLRQLRAWDRAWDRARAGVARNTKGPKDKSQGQAGSRCRQLPTCKESVWRKLTVRLVWRRSKKHLKAFEGFISKIPLPGRKYWGKKKGKENTPQIDDDEKEAAAEGAED